MTDITLYHNPRCSKSRAALALLEENEVKPKLVLYLDNAPTIEELQELLRKLGIGLNDLLRRGEPEYDELGLGDESLSESIKLDLVSKHPQLLQRPIAIKGDRAIIGRPPENVLQLLED